MARIAILGAGDMGTAVLTPLAGRHEVRLWGSAHDAAIVATLQAREPHPRLGVSVPETVRVLPASRLGEALDRAEIVVLAVSSQGVRPVMQQSAPFLAQARAFVILSKGLEQAGSGAPVQRFSEVAAEYTSVPVVAVGGPGIAREVALGIPTVAVFGSASREALQVTQGVFGTPTYLVETTTDIAGVELAAALKNAFALSFGMVDGAATANQQPHANLRAALLPRVMAELRNLVAALGGQPETVDGQAGLGDLQVTATTGRNRLLGERIGAGAAAADAVQDLSAAGITTEGFAVTSLGYQLARGVCEGDDAAVRRRFPLLAGLQRIATADAPPLATLWDAVRAGEG
ncbi:MAG: NAD(P)-binding domain-containing protein [Thermomicrobiales bacterium]|nr:NAD(P)-binding domain-containing protein [Thermomicrobiales bacterium]